jgi:DNA replication protein DnaC
MKCNKCNVELRPQTIDIPFIGSRTFYVCDCPDDRLSIEDSRKRAYWNDCRVPEETKGWIAKGITEESTDASGKKLIDNDNREGLIAAREYCKQFENNIDEGRGLIFIGTPGTVKTVIMSLILKYACDKCITSRWIGYRKIVKIITDESYREDMAEELDRIARYRLTLIDDIGCSELASWQRNHVNYLIDQRFEKKMPTLYTSNLTDSEISERLGADIWSRIKGTCKIVVMSGRDRRIK